MRDIRLVRATALLQVDTVIPIRGFLPPSVIVMGAELYKAKEVEYNEILVSEFIVSDRNRLIVRIPDSQVGKALTSIRALADVSVTRADAVLALGPTTPITDIKGVERLVQAWVTLFLTTPGSDIFDKASGGGGYSLIGKSTDRTHQSISASVAMAVQKTKADLFRLQAKAQNVPLDEQLLSSELTSVAFDPSTSTLRATVSLRNMAGDTASVLLR